MLFGAYCLVSECTFWRSVLSDKEKRWDGRAKKFVS